MTTALVTGGAGLIGSHIVDALCEAGHEVRVLDKLVEPTHQGRPDWLRPDVDYVIGDIRSPTDLRRALQGVEVLFHLAAFGGFAPGAADYFETNVTSYARILEVAQALGGRLRTAVVASSQAIYGEGTATCPEHGAFDAALRSAEDLERGRWTVPCPACGADATPSPTPESATAAPNSPYALSKLFLETAGLRLGPAYGVSTTMMRFGLTFGRRQSPTNPYCGIVSLFTQRMLRNKPILIYEDGRQRRDFISARDVARACVLTAFDDRASGRVFNVGTGLGTKVLDVVHRLAELLGVEPSAVMPGWYRVGEVRDLITDATALSVLGWKPEVSLEDALTDFVAWFRERPLPPDPFPAGVRHMRAAGIVRTRSRPIDFDD
ncbi:NAD-dependent epimerase/dehydratase family protein [Tenggerimyces flavus]|uniref:NAD-dependent epimerase/dehydratase family protein n=1 Tax=Tenggerimyces flavus TaxID=1708749 RepID=A0ABV7YLA7_9ACTN|nr:NAD-dependent epimerase/dehydratase family protein [Tenggerimyces flavus]MBM7789582.1 dTDP-L-rhamnose 4-epimerase [Tenggerimyces flavus]